MWQKMVTFLSSNNLLREIPGSIAALTELEELGLAHNRLRDLPDLSSLQHLRVLSLYWYNYPKFACLTDSNYMNKLEDWICELTCITKLDISRNRIRCLPRHLLALPKLKYLNLRNNFLEDVSDIAAFATDNHEDLHIDLSFNRLGYLPFKLSEKVTRILCKHNPFKKDDMGVVNSLLPLTALAYMALDNKYLPTRMLREIHSKSVTCDNCGKGMARPIFERKFIHGETRIPIVQRYCSMSCLK
jgi:Leucine-rich repeat (LRR) protein